MVGLLFGCVADWLVDPSVCWSVGWLIGWLVGWLVGAFCRVSDIHVCCLGNFILVGFSVVSSSLFPRDNQLLHV